MQTANPARLAKDTIRPGGGVLDALIPCLLATRSRLCWQTASVEHCECPWCVALAGRYPVPLLTRVIARVLLQRAHAHWGSKYPTACVRTAGFQPCMIFLARHACRVVPHPSQEHSTVPCDGDECQDARRQLCAALCRARYPRCRRGRPPARRPLTNLELGKLYAAACSVSCIVPRSRSCG